MVPARPPAATVPAPADTPTELVDLTTCEAWERILARIERRLRSVEAAALRLLDRELEREQRAEAVRQLDLLAAWFGQLGVIGAAHLARQLRMVLDDDTPDVSAAMTAAALIEDLRTVLAGVIAELEAVPEADRRLRIVGPLDARTDSVVWVAMMSGFAVEVDTARLEPDTEPDVVLVNAADATAVSTMTLLRALREERPGVPVVVVHDGRTLAERVELASSATTVLDTTAGPREVVDELVEVHRRCTVEASVAVVGVEPAVVARLNGRRLHAWATDLDTAMEQLAGSEARGLVLGEDVPQGLSPHQVTRLVRANPAVRNAVVALAATHPDVERRAADAAAGADLTLDVAAPGHALVTSLLGALERRSASDPTLADERRAAALPWASARILIERRLVMAVRRDEVVSVLVLAGEDAAGVEELTARQESLAREFRCEDVVARWSEGRQVVVLQGVGRRTAVQRIGGVLKGVGDLAEACRVGVAEFPYDGRSLDELLDAATGAIERARTLGGPAIVATDWRPEAETNAEVLLVDPDQTLAAVLSSVLGRSGVRTDHLTDGMQVLDHLTGPRRHAPPKLLVCEFDVPGIDGLQLLRRLRDIGLLGRFRVIMLAAGLRENQLRRALELGVADVVRKPFSPTMFVHRVQRALDT